MSRKGKAAWTKECTDAVNSLVQWVFARVRLHQAPAGAQLQAYPSVHAGTGFVALTMKLSKGDERE